ncbi:hypothetical protein DFH11DRAFT_252577 [Phellopilus nigrolimitatus]|nr:hypothetical protein DFH11DRAFT_252577 [Phellopilus nigrolimitatus]
MRRADSQGLPRAYRLDDWRVHGLTFNFETMLQAHNTAASPSIAQFIHTSSVMQQQSDVRLLRILFAELTTFQFLTGIIPIVNTAQGPTLSSLSCGSLISMRTRHVMDDVHDGPLRREPQLSNQIENRTICALGYAAAWLIRHFRPEVEARIAAFRARQRVRKPRGASYKRNFLYEREKTSEPTRKT